MRYTSENGCLFYYDRILYSWKICEPTMLFLLGFDAITSFEKSLSDTITASKYIYLSDVNELAPLEKFDIFDNIYSYLSEIGTVEDFEAYLHFNCYGLKLLMNDLTGMSVDRTVPIIFRNDVNETFLKYNTTDGDNSLSFYDRQAQKIYDIFDFAEYDLTDSAFIKKCLGESPVLGSKPIKPNRDDYDSDEDYDRDLAKYIEDLEQYNITKQQCFDYKKAKNELKESEIMKIHSERKSTSEIYTRLDYKSMYSYALGVLYGCRCFGYDTNLIWRVNPDFWYTGEYKNLVKTAWVVFRFHYTDKLPVTEKDKQLFNKYRGIQLNRLWNYSDEDTCEPLKEDEIQCYSVNRKSVDIISYSPGTCSHQNNDSDHECLGSYLHTDSENTSEWRPIEELIVDDDPFTPDADERNGILAVNDDPIIRYLSNNKIKIYKAYQYQSAYEHASTDTSDSDIYLSPNQKDIYFIGAGHLGWVDYDDVSWLDKTKSVLTISPVEYENLIKRSKAKIDSNDESEEPEYDYYLGLASNKEDGSAVGYYKCYINSDNSRALYGIFDEGFSINGTYPSYTYTFPDNKFFKEIVSDIDFLSDYDLIVNPGVDYVISTYYNLSTPISLYVKKGSDWQDDVIYNQTGASQFVVDHGYSPVEAYQISNIYVHNYGENRPADSELRSFNLNYTSWYWTPYRTESVTVDVTYDEPVFASSYLCVINSSDHLIDYEESIKLHNTYTDEYIEFNTDDYTYEISSVKNLSNEPYADLAVFDLVSIDNKVAIRYIGSESSIEVGEVIINTYALHASETLQVRRWFTEQTVKNDQFYYTNSTIDLYRGSNRIVDSTPMYTRYKHKATLPDTLPQYIFNRGTVYEEHIDSEVYFSELPVGFLKVGIFSENENKENSIYHMLGVTDYICPFIESDTDGYPLVDENDNYCVWQDPDTGQYWNGLYGANKWQDEIPHSVNSVLIDASTGREVSVFDKPNEGIIIIDNVEQPYSWVYNENNNYGIIRTDTDKTANRVFNPDVSENILQCYHDSVSDKYYIPYISYEMHEWVDRATISNMGWRFVDGLTSLYMGEDVTSVVYDDDSTD